MSSSLINSIKTTLALLREPDPYRSSKYAQDGLENILIYTIKSESDQSYDVDVWILHEFKHKDTGQSMIYPHPSDPVTTKTIFDKSAVENNEKLQISITGDKLPTMSARIFREEGFPVKIQQHLNN